MCTILTIFPNIFLLQFKIHVIDYSNSLFILTMNSILLYEYNTKFWVWFSLEAITNSIVITWSNMFFYWAYT